MMIASFVYYVCWRSVVRLLVYVFFFKQKTAYEMRISDWSSDVCSSDLPDRGERVLDVVAPRHRQLDPVERAYIAVAVAHRDIETVRTAFGGHVDPAEIGRASCRERVCQYV